MLKYTEEHEWIRLEQGDIAVVGITDHAQEQLGELVYVELPQLGTKFAQGDCSGVVESTKTASDIYAPVDGEVIEVNSALENQPDLVNNSAESKGWLYKLKVIDLAQLDQLLDEKPL